MTTITLTEADRIELPAPQYAERFALHRRTNIDGSIAEWIDRICEDGSGVGHFDAAYLLPEIKIAEPEKPPGMVQGIYDGERVWVYRFVGDSVRMIFPSGYHATKYVGGVEIINNPHNDPTLSAAIRAAQEGK